MCRCGRELSSRTYIQYDRKFSFFRHSNVCSQSVRVLWMIIAECKVRKPQTTKVKKRSSSFDNRSLSHAHHLTWEIQMHSPHYFHCESPMKTRDSTASFESPPPTRACSFLMLSWGLWQTYCGIEAYHCFLVAHWSITERPLAFLQGIGLECQRWIFREAKRKRKKKKCMF